MPDITVHPEDVLALVKATKGFKNQKVNRLARCAGILTHENERLKRSLRWQRERNDQLSGQIKAAREALNG